MQTTTLLIIFAFLILIGVLIVIYLLLLNQNQNTTFLDAENKTLPLIVNLLSDIKNNFQSNSVQHTEILQQRIDQIVQQIGSHQRTTSQHLLQQHHTQSGVMQNVTEKLAAIESTNKQILGFAEQMKSLERILQNPKQRGILGEYFLQTLLSNVLQPHQYTMQYRFETGVIVDAAVFFKDKIVPIDAKFPLSKYNQMLQSTDKLQLAELERLFWNDVKLRIDETAKYILPQCKTTEFAMMFIPAEGVYYYLLNYSDAKTGLDLISYGFEKRVVVVSPSSLYAYLETILQGLNALKIEESAKEVIKKVAELQLRLQQFEQHQQKIGKLLHQTLDAYEQLLKEWDKIDKTIVATQHANLKQQQKTLL